MSFGTLALLVAAGLCGPLLAGLPRLAPPAVLGEILAGIVIGPTVLSWVDPTSATLRTFADIGFAMLMFVVATHLPLRDAALRPALRRGTLLAICCLAIAVAAGQALARGVGFDRPWLLTTLLTTSSAAIALPVLQDLGTAGSGRVGRRDLLVTTSWIAVSDVATVLMIPFVLPSGSVGRVLLGAALVVAASACCYGLALVLRGRRVITSLRAASQARGWALDLRVALLVLFTLAWLATRFGTTLLLAGFAAGATVSLIGEPRRVAQQTIGLAEGFFVPVFFVDLGLRLDVRAFVHDRDALVLGALLAVLATVAHVSAAMAFRLPVGLGLLATAQMGVPAAVVSVGLHVRALTPAEGTAIMGSVLLALAVSSVGSLMLGRVHPIRDPSAPA